MKSETEVLRKYEGPMVSYIRNEDCWSVIDAFGGTLILTSEDWSSLKSLVDTYPENAK